MAATTKSTQSLEELLELVEDQWRTEFLEFIQTGEATPEFLAYIDNNAQCQDALETAFNMQAEAFERLATALKASEEAQKRSPPRPKNAPAETRTEKAVLAILTTLGRVGGLSRRERDTVFKRAVADFTASAPPKERRTVAEAATALTKEVGRAVGVNHEHGGV